MQRRAFAKKELIDPATGEVYELYLWGKPKHVQDKGFVKIMNAFLEELVVNEEIVGKAIRLLLWMIARMDYNTLHVVVFHDEAMRELQISKQTFYNWLKVLQKHGIVERIGKYRYRLRPHAVVRGTMHEACKDELDF